MAAGWNAASECARCIPIKIADENRLFCLSCNLYFHLVMCVGVQQSNQGGGSAHMLDITEAGTDSAGSKSNTNYYFGS